RLDELRLQRSEVPTLTVAVDASNWVFVEGSDRKDLYLRYCFEVEKERAKKLRSNLDELGMTRRGTVVSVPYIPNYDEEEYRGSPDWVRVDAPRDQPIVVHASALAQVHVRRMSAPLKISAYINVAGISECTGPVDVSAGSIQYSGAGGRVTLTAHEYIAIRMTAVQFDGSLDARAGTGQVGMQVPLGFVTPFKAVVSRPEAFICRADICSGVTYEKQGPLHVYTYNGRGAEANASPAGRSLKDAGRTAPDRFQLRSEDSVILIDNPSTRK
ncbi:MAG TPA: hypothetical protein VFY29_01010, partial [Terriglobia bacterium]|nr:hypothetical protein [Terriglobia bacterium]